MGKFEQIIEARQKLYSLSEELVPSGQPQRRPPVWNTAPNQQAGQQAVATGTQQGSDQVGQVATDATAAAQAAASPAPATAPAGGTAPAVTPVPPPPPGDAKETPAVATPNAETALQSQLGMSPEQAKKAAQIVNSIQNGQV